MYLQLLFTCKHALCLRLRERERERERERDSHVVCGESKPFAPSIFLMLSHKLALESVFLPFIC